MGTQRKTGDGTRYNNSDVFRPTGRLYDRCADRRNIEFYFGQGPWTPFQMFSWGIVGLIAGVFAPQLKKSLVFRIIYSAVSGVLYSLLMDIYTTLWYDGTFNLTRYIAAVTSAVPVTLTYVVSNVAFIIVLAKPIGSVLERIKTKYGMQ